MKLEFIRFLSAVQIQPQDDPDAIEKQRRAEQARATITAQHPDAQAEAQTVGAEEGVEEDGAPSAQPMVRGGRKVGRNEPCPCGSGKKYKQCHGKLS